MDMSKQSGIGIDCYVITYDRMTLYTPNGISVFIRRKFLSRQADPLKYPDIIPDNTGLANNRSGPMVNREMMPDTGTRMNIDACFRMSQFGYDTGNIRYLQKVQLMSYPIVTNRPKTRIAKNDLAQVLCGRVSIIGSFRIGCQQIPESGQCRDKLPGELFRLFVQDVPVIRQGVEILHYVVPFWPTYVLIEILSGSVRGAGDSLIPMIMTSIGVCVTRILWAVTVVPMFAPMMTEVA